MDDEKNLKEQFNILFEDLDGEAEEKIPAPESKDEKVKEFFSDAFEDAKEKTEEFSFDDFEEDDAPKPAPRRHEEKKEERKPFSEEEERTRRKIYEMGRDEDDEFPSFEPTEKEKKADAPNKASLKKESKRFWIFTAIIALLTVAAILFILFSRGILGGKPKDTEPAGTEPVAIEPSKPADDPSSTVPDITETEPTETEPVTEPATEEPVPEDAGLAEILKKYPNFFMVDANKVSSELRVRTEPDTTRDNVIAKLSRNAGGNIDATEGDWLKITSGSFSGYVKAEYCLTGNAAKNAIIPLIRKQVEVKETAKIREGADKVDTGQRAGAGDVFDLLGEDGDYYRITFNGGEKYIAKSVVNVKCSIEEAVAP